MGSAGCAAFVVALVVATSGCAKAQAPWAGSTIVLEVEKASDRAAVMEAAQRQVSGRVDLSGAEVMPEGDNRIVVRLPNISDDEAKQVADRLTARFETTINLVDAQAGPKNYVPEAGDADRLTLWSETGDEMLVLVEPPVVKGADFAGADAFVDPNTGQATVSFQLTEEAGARFEAFTADNMGERFAIVVNQHLIAAPRIAGRVRRGSVSITGRFTLDEASKLAVAIRSSGMPQYSFKVIDISDQRFR